MGGHEAGTSALPSVSLSPWDPLASRKVAATLCEMDDFNRVLVPCPAQSLPAACGPLLFQRLQYI